jgi:hypothetical protein
MPLFKVTVYMSGFGTKAIEAEDWEEAWDKIRDEIAAGEFVPDSLENCFSSIEGTEELPPQTEEETPCRSGQS